MARRIYVIWTHPLFHESVRRLLAGTDALWVGAARDQDQAGEELTYLRPDTILIEEGAQRDPELIFNLLSMCPWNVRVISLSLADNKLTLYTRRSSIVARAADLLSLIENQEGDLGRQHVSS